MPTLREILEKQRAAKAAAAMPVAAPAQPATEIPPPIPNGKAADDIQPTQMVAATPAPPIDTAKLSPLQRAKLAAKEAKAKEPAQVVAATPIVKPSVAVQTSAVIPSGAITKTQVVATSATAAGTGLSEVTLEQIQSNIRYLSENIEHRDLVGQVVRTIFMQLKQNPQFSTLISDNEFDVITRGFMASYHAAARKRVEGKEKKSAKAEIKAKVGASVDVMFDELDKFFK